jgi:hypothetical protein
LISAAAWDSSSSSSRELAADAEDGSGRLSDAAAAVVWGLCVLLV